MNGNGMPNQNRPDRRFLFQPLLSVLLLAVTLFPVFADSAPAQRLSKYRLKNGFAVRKAFRDVVAGPSRWTVRVKAEKKDVALGTIVGADGWILTKASELKGALRCRLKDGRELDARLVGFHEEYDLAMLKIDGNKLPTVEWKQNDDPQVGQWLATPGIGRTPVAVGVVSVKRRTIPRLPGILGIAFDPRSKPGARITLIMPKGGAEKAGLKKGDVVLKVDGQTVKDGAALQSRIRSFRPADTLTLRIKRGDKQLDVKATLGHSFHDLFDRAAFMNRLGGKLSTRRSGFPSTLQHDSILRPQDCGGAVVDLSGKAMGINIARAGRTESYALPPDVILPLLDDLKSGKLAPPVAQVTAPKEPPPPPLPEDEKTK